MIAFFWLLFGSIDGAVELVHWRNKIHAKKRKIGFSRNFCSAIYTYSTVFIFWFKYNFANYPLNINLESINTFIQPLLQYNLVKRKFYICTSFLPAVEIQLLLQQRPLNQSSSKEEVCLVARKSPLFLTQYLRNILVGWDICTCITRARNYPLILTGIDIWFAIIHWSSF